MLRMSTPSPPSSRTRSMPANGQSANRPNPDEDVSQPSAGSTVIGLSVRS
jgi:hypothetical protein